MSLPIVLSTKLFFPPARENLVSRPRLLEKVTRGLQSRLLLISAPAGYGKTTLMSEWRAGVGNDYPAVWLSLDRDDNDFNCFISSLSFALTSIKPGFDEDTLPLLQSSPPLPDRVILTCLINELGIVEKSASLILDDYHVISTQSIHEAVTYLLDNLPSNINLVILTRADPPLPLPRLRARNRLAEIRAADLCFSTDEAYEFLKKVMGLSLSLDQVSALEERTEGWVAGLQLAALSMQGREDLQYFISEFAGSHHYIVDFLADEVLNNQSETILEFLLSTSILDQLTAPLCNAITGQPNSAAILEQLEHSNLFLIPLDDQQQWYRYHHLFIEVLRKRLSQTRPDIIADLHYKAMTWCEQNGFIVQAVEHAFAIKDYSQVVRLFSNHYWQNLTINYPFQVRRWIKSFPDSIIRNDPFMSVVFAWWLWGQGDREGAEDYLSIGQQSLDLWTASDLLPEDNREYAGLASEIPAFQGLIQISRGNLDRAFELTNKALANAKETDVTNRGIVYLNLHLVQRERGEVAKALEACLQAIPLTQAGGVQGPIVDSRHYLGLMYMVQGQLSRAAQIYRDNIEYAEKEWPKNSPRCSIFHIYLAEINYEWNNLDEAERLAQQALEISDPVFRWVRIYARIFLAKLENTKLNQPKAHQIIEEAGSLLRQSKGHLFERELEFYFANVSTKLGINDNALQWISNFSIDITDSPGYEKLYIAIQIAQMLGTLDKDDDLLALLSQIEPLIVSLGYVYWQIQSLVLQAITWQKQGNPRRALTFIEKALSLAEKEGFVRVFLDEGESIVYLLQQAATKGIHPDYARKLLSAALQAEKKAQPVQLLIEPLSERELEVLRLVAEGMSNQQIAEILVIATGTVKKHINNIFGKLGAQSRTQCVARGRELGLL